MLYFRFIFSVDICNVYFCVDFDSNHTYAISQNEETVKGQVTSLKKNIFYSRRRMAYQCIKIVHFVQLQY